jgi:hypothetical protein
MEFFVVVKFGSDGGRVRLFEWERLTLRRLERDELVASGEVE